MTEVLRHRGPDDSGVLVTGSAGLGHSRLSIIDLTDAGHQPFQTADGKAALVYNGEVYNFPELRRRLADEGVQFRSRTDSEVVLQAVVKWGESVFARLNGMFAFAIWDVDTETLRIVRDRFGIKPLYYYPLESGLVFGSEIKAILASGRVRRGLNWQGLHEYLYYGHPLGENTLFDGVLELLPGHCLTINRQGCSLTPYWRIEDIKPVHGDTEQAAVGVRERLEQAVKDHLVSDVPVGVFLSGGIDSSAITAFASKHYCGKLQTFAVGFDYDRGVNELPKARLVAERFNTDHQELHLAGGDMPSVIEKLVRCHDEPFADAANIPLYLLCDSLKGQIKVVLQGDGGDEVFAGYRRYNLLRYERFWRSASRIASAIAPLVPRGPGWYRAMRFFRAMGHPDPATRMALLLTEEQHDDPPTRTLTTESRERLLAHDPFQRYSEAYGRLRHLDTVQRMLYADCLILLPDQFLEKVDKSTMAHSIEVRVPFLDANLTSHALGLSSSLKIRFAQKKWILRRALRGILPNAILDAPKTGFGVPYQYWLRKPLAGYMKSVLLDDATLGWGLFDRRQLERCIDEHITGRRNNGFLLYKLLNLALWRSFYLH